MESLATWNYAAAVVHLVATILSAVLLTSKARRTVQLVRYEFNDGAPPQDSRVDIPVRLKNDVKVDLKYLLVGFFGVTALAHFLYATDFFGRGWYSSAVLGFGWNPYRWVEYSISAGLMIYLISIASGTKDQVTAVSAALITPGLMVNGFTNERALQQNALHAWSLDPSNVAKPTVDAEIVFSNLIPAWLLFFVHWYIIFSNYGALSKEAKAANKPLDPGVTFMVYSQLFFFSLFGVIQTYQVYRWFTSRPGRIEWSFLTYEKAYIVLSAVTKLLLAATVFYALRN